MISPLAPAEVGVLVSGGLDSCVLLHRLLDDGHSVQPIYINSGLVWQRCEQAALRSFLAQMATPRLRDVVVLEMPLADVYGRHWSVTGDGVPSAGSLDAAVFLPGRNALLIVKAAIWCQLNRVDRLALAPLAGNPFADATAGFLKLMETVLNRGAPRPLRLSRPFGDLDKLQVMRLGSSAPLELTFSCIAPLDELHCGRCNKCAERQAAFRLASLEDRTRYAAQPPHQGSTPPLG